MITLPCCIIVFLAIGKVIVGDIPSVSGFHHAQKIWPEEDADTHRVKTKRDVDVLHFENTKRNNNIDMEKERHKRNDVPHNYTRLLEISILFYEAQRSGKLPANNRISWRGDSALDDMTECGNVSGGWYDAGDNIKFNLPMATSTSILGYSIILFKDAYIQSNEYRNAQDQIKWTCDYFIKCHYQPNLNVFQFGDDHTEWTRSENMTVPRVPFQCNCTSPGSDVAGASAAALATCAIVWQDRDPAYAEKCVEWSRSLYRFGMTHRGQYPSPDNYISGSFGDDLAWAAGLLHLATGEQIYLNDAEALYDEYSLSGRAYAVGWGSVKELVKVLLWNITSNVSYRERVENFLDYWMPNNTDGIPYTPGGLAYRSIWGSLRYAANTACLAMVAVYNGLDTNGKYADYVCRQIGYILGDNPYNRSYVIGYGHDFPKKPHHRGSSCPATLSEPCLSTALTMDADNPSILYGGLVGGPDVDDWWADDRQDYVQNEVACDYNAGFQCAIAGLKYMQVQGNLPASCNALPAV